ncbi:MAG TPA: hypothetical protein PK678_09665 [Ferruginibacter sp.]|nr:hypothetical protein [Chitinophagales bacterium]HMW26995.1 hypothetical protein [Ferruginibacter sp.]HMX36467.1 hypothetical protein [Ferruginibacter sp.]HNA16773.1 hypothetical protein [Ferruginibacter sp.]HNF03163.1 hypothetical protein [Ferruginibacter sp.]
MEIINYKTNINSEKALTRLAPYLDRAVGASNWQLNLHDEDRTLSVFSPGLVNEQVVVNAVHHAGFMAMNLDDYYSIC